MLAIPAIDLRDGTCVQLAAESHDRELIRISDPVGVALAWEQYGFRHLHVIDLDGAIGKANNRDQINAILGATDAEVQVGGGIRDREGIEEVIDAGAQRVVLGRRALQDPEWLIDMTSLYPGLIITAMDVRDRRVLSAGWARGDSRLAPDLVEELNELPLAGVMVTMSNQGERLQSSDLALLEDLAEIAEFPVYASGGLETIGDLRALEDRGVAAAIIGIALYAGSIDPRVAAEEFSDAAGFF